MRAVSLAPSCSNSSMSTPYWQWRKKTPTNLENKEQVKVFDILVTEEDPTQNQEAGGV